MVCCSLQARYVLASGPDIFGHGQSGFTGFYGALETGRRFYENASDGLGDITSEWNTVKEIMNARNTRYICGHCDAGGSLSR